MSEYTPAEREADRRFIESRLAPENEQRADDFITGADWQYAENIRKLKRHTDDQLAALLVQALIEGNYLAAHDREVAAKALRDAAQDSQMGPVAYGWSASGIASWLKARANQIEEGAGE